ncbi:hypothetical protein HZ326_24749 [Fusarium oxysporum f. sp. albedinis]|nr:hypothetical protein HZ326_24749 [Fusarium oxysporum f. sp. albedinis]
MAQESPIQSYAQTIRLIQLLVVLKKAITHPVHSYTAQRPALHIIQMIDMLTKWADFSSPLTSVTQFCQRSFFLHEEQGYGRLLSII